MSGSLTSGEKALCWLYGLIAIAALVGTQWVLVDSLAGQGAVADFLRGTVEGSGPRFVTIDLLAVAITATVFMIADGTRVGVRRLWVYVLLVFAVAISVAFPLYLIARTRTIAAARGRLNAA